MALRAMAFGRFDVCNIAAFFMEELIVRLQHRGWPQHWAYRVPPVRCMHRCFVARALLHIRISVYAADQLHGQYGEVLS